MKAMAVYGRELVRESPQTLHEQTLGSLLNETFVIYSKQIWKFMRLVAVVQVPVGLLALFPRENVAIFVILDVLGLIALVCVYGAMVRAVGQHYLKGEINIASCYSNVWHRVLSLGALGAAVAVVGLGSDYLGTTALTGQSAAGAIFFVLSIPILALLVYSVFAPPAVMMEGLNPIGAVRRSYMLVRGSWWKVFGVSLVIALVIVGLGILLSIPFALASALAGIGEPSAMARAVLTLNSIVVGVAVLPVLFTGLTLLYYDLRVRKEHFDLEALTQEMGVAAT